MALLLRTSIVDAESADGAVSKESKLRAAYFLNFILFINGQNHSRASSLALLYICLQDETPFEDFFRALAETTPSAGAKIKLQIYPLSEAAQCDYSY